SFLLSFSFENCILNYSSFFKLKLKKIIFKGCRLQEVDFSEADLSGASFDQSDLSGAIFYSSRLEKADFSTAEHFSIDPENSLITGAKFSTHNLQGLLNKYKIEIL
ncbi:pentapeptide repeat-containing protein, partial [Salinimicrobium oceani]